MNGTFVAIGAIGNDGMAIQDTLEYLNMMELIGTIRKDIDGEAEGDESGYSVSLSADGTIVAIGAPSNDGNGNHSGHVRVFEYDGTNWNN